MRVDAYVGAGDCARWGRGGLAFAAFCLLSLTASAALAFDGTAQNGPKITPPKSFASVGEALRVGIDDLNAGNAASCVEALTYAADGGEPMARWKLGEMYADGVGVQRDDLKAYHYFNKLVEDYDEDAPDQRSRSAISNAFVAIGVYKLTGIPNSEVRPDPQRARELFQYAASAFGNPDAQYNLAHMYIVGGGGLAKDPISALRWLGLASSKGHKPSQALFGHMLFIGDGVQPQRAKGLMWLEIAKTGADGAKDDWIRELYDTDAAAASKEERHQALIMANERKDGLPSFISRSIVKTFEFLRKPLTIPSLGGASVASTPSKSGD